MSGVRYPTGFDAVELAAGNPLTRPRIGYQTYTKNLTDSNVSVSTELDDGPKDAPLRPDTGEYWEPTVVPATWDLDLGSLQDIDYVGIAGHNLGSVGSTILVETSADGNTYSTFGADAAISPSDNSPIMFLDELVSHRYIRITITVAIARIAVIYVGEVLKMEEEVLGPHAPITLSRETKLYRSLSRGGQFLGQGFRRKNVVTGVSFSHLSSSWVRDTLDPFIEEARSRPYFFAWRPLDFPLEVAYVWPTDDIRPQQMGMAGFMSVDWTMMGMGNE